MLSRDQIKDIILKDLEFEGFRNRRYRFSKFSVSGAKELMVNRDFEAIISKEDSLFFTPSKKDESFSILDSALQAAREQKDKESKAIAALPPDPLSDVTPSEFLSSLEAFIDITRDMADSIVFLKDGRFIDNISPTQYLNFVGLSINEFWSAYKDRKCHVEYNPLSETKKRKSAPGSIHGGLVVLNTYNHPAWRLRTDIKPRYGGFMKRFMEHLFPFKEDRDYVMWWMRNCIESKCDTVLLLVGTQGTGKSFLFSTIIKALVGLNNYGAGSENTFTSKFNSVVVNKRFVYFDEVPLDKEAAIERLKAMTDREINTESKGEDEKRTPNFASYGLANNHTDKFSFNPADRKFSTPVITKVDMQRVFTKEEIDSFKKGCDATAEDNMGDFTDIAEFGFYLLKEFGETVGEDWDETPTYYSPRAPLKNDFYYELCMGNMPGWKAALIRLFSTAEPGFTLFTSKVMGDTINKAGIFPKMEKIRAFLETYKHLNEYSLGTIIAKEGAPKKKEVGFDFEVNLEFARAFKDAQARKETREAELERIFQISNQ